MRKITKQATEAFLNSKKFNSKNTSVQIAGNVVYLKLHDNPIAKLENGKIFVTSAGWETNTTKDRLNGIPGVHVSQFRYQWYLNGKLWERPHQWTEI